MDLRIAIRSGCFWAGIGLVLAKVMEAAKEIRPDDKKRVKTGVKTPINRRPGWVPGGSVVCWRMLGCWRMVWPAVVDGWRLMLQAGRCWPFWVPERQGGRETPPGVVVLSVVARSPGGWSAGGGLLGGLLGCFWLSAGDGWGGCDPAAIRRYLISN